LKGEFVAEYRPFSKKLSIFRNETSANQASKWGTWIAVVRTTKMKNTVTPEQRFEIGKLVADRLGKISADKDEVQCAIESGNHPFWSEVEKHFGQKSFEVMFAEQLASWAVLYNELGVEFDSTKVKMPVHREGFDRLIVIPKGMTAQKAFKLCLARFAGKCWKYTDASLDEAVPTNDRTAKDGSYAIWIRDCQEADEELRSKSANDLSEEGIKGITLCERLLFEIKYHAETGKHLDIKNWTLCSGSRYSDGRVPLVDWDCDKLFVYWCIVSRRNPDLRSRAVSL